MTTLTEWINRVKYFARRARFDSELNTEVEFHIESRAEELQRTGCSPRDAMRQARMEFGATGPVAEQK